MWPFSKLGSEGELVALFDIGSSSVGGALFYLRKSSPPHIVFSIREPIALDKKFDFDKFFSSTLKALDGVAEKLARSGKGNPKKFFCAVSSPWYGSQTRVVRFEKDTPFVFTAAMADELTQKEAASFHQEHASVYAMSGGKVLPIELKNMKTMLNGYPTSSPLNQKAREVEMTIFLSMSSENFLKKIQNVVIKHFHRDEVKFASFAFISFAVARQMFPEKDAFLLVDIGGELTDLSLIKHDVISASVSFPKGLNFMTREIANTLKCSFEEARSLLSIYQSGHASAPMEKKLESLIEKLKREWLDGFQQSLASLSHDISLPPVIFVTVEREFGEFFSDIIKTEQFSQYTLTESKFEVVFLGTPELHGEAVLDRALQQDPFVILESIYISRFLR